MPPNKITSLGAAITLLLLVRDQWRGASEFNRWTA
jgi:hypothetical protein